MVSGVKVEVKQGTVVGGEDTLPNGSSYHFFKGIPYAVPPLEELRFKAPVPLERFSSPEIDCTKEGAVSLQGRPGGKIFGSEDCLFLNVYKPKCKSDAVLPVMVFIHGGSFITGSGNSNSYNPLYLLQEDVVVVTFNYRLGVLGCLSLPGANIYGNAALKDQRLVLRWVKENIAQFNGDPNNVTLFGESGGGACVHIHTLTQSDDKLFHKAIIQSGSSTNTWAIDRNSFNTTKKMARRLGCTAEDPSEITKFILSIDDPKEFVKLTLEELILDNCMLGLPFPNRLVIEKENPDAILTKSPEELMNTQHLIDIPIMMGINTAEGCIRLDLVLFNLEKIGFDETFRKFIPRNLPITSKDQESLILANMIKEFYFKGSEPTKNIVCDMVGDFFFNMQNMLAVETHSRKQHKSPLYFYKFNYDGELNFYKNKIFRLKDVAGASHADDLCYIFQSKLGPEPWQEDDKKMVKIMCRLWTNFAKYSNPTPTGEEQSLVDCIWEPVRSHNDSEEFTLNTFVIDKQQKMIQNPLADRMEFWRNVERTFSNEKNLSKL